MDTFILSKINVFLYFYKIFFRCPEPRYVPELPETTAYGMGRIRRFRIEDQARNLGITRLPREMGRRRIPEAEIFRQAEVRRRILNQLQIVWDARNSRIEQHRAEAAERELFLNVIYNDLDAGILDDVLGRPRMERQKPDDDSDEGVVSWEWLKHFIIYY